MSRVEKGGRRVGGRMSRMERGREERGRRVGGRMSRVEREGG